MDYVLSGASIVTIIMGLVELIKKVGLSSRFAPLFSLVFGILLAALGQGGFSVDSIISGLVLGLVASGFWSGAKAVSGK